MLLVTKIPVAVPITWQSFIMVFVSHTPLDHFGSLFKSVEVAQHRFSKKERVFLSKYGLLIAHIQLSPYSQQNGCAANCCVQLPMHQLGEDNRKLVWCIPSLPQSVAQENWPFYARHVPWPLLRHLPGVHLLVWAPSEPQFSDQRKRAWLTVTLEAEFCVTCLNDEPAHFCHQVLETATALLLCGQCCTHVRIPVMNYQYCHRGGPHMRSLISVDFPAPEMEPESAHVVSAVSVP